MGSIYQFSVLLICFLCLGKTLVLGDDAHELHEGVKEKGDRPEVVLPKISCIIMKSLAYGLQKAVKDYSLGGSETNLSRALQEVDIEHYLSDICPVNPVVPLDTSKPSAATRPDSESSSTSGAKKVKRNQHSHHSPSQRNKPNMTNSAVLTSTSNTTQTNTTKEATKAVNHFEHHQQLKSNEFERLLRNFEEVTNALRSQLKLNDLNENHQLAHAQPANAAEHFAKPGKPAISENTLNNQLHNTPNIPAVASLAPVNNETNVVETPVEKSRHSHSHNHKKHKHAKSKSKSKDAFPLDEDNLTDDRHVSERLKLEEAQENHQEYQVVKTPQGQDVQDNKDNKVNSKDVKLNQEFHKHQVKRSVGTGSDKGKDKAKDKESRHTLHTKNNKFAMKSKHFKSGKSKSYKNYNKMQRKTKTKGKTYHKSRT